MKKFMVLIPLLLLVGILFLVAGCGNKSDEGTATKSAVEIATRDCDGGCGMKNVPVDKMTEIDGKFYCSTCSTPKEGDDHSGHKHN